MAMKRRTELRETWILHPTREAQLIGEIPVGRKSIACLGMNPV